MKRLISASLAALLPMVANAQTQKDIEEITVQGKFYRLPLKKVNENITVITKDEIKNAPSTSIDELLQQFAGVDVRRRGSNGVQSDISVRGTTFEQVAVFLNNIRMNDSQTGHNTMNIPVDLADIERIEVVKGPAARRFGNGTYAAINIITKIVNGKSVNVRAEGGDFETYNLGTSLNLGSEKASMLLSANSGASGGYRHNTDYNIRNVFLQNRYHIKNGSIGLQAGFSEKKFGANGFYASPAATEQYEEVQASVVALSHRQQFNNLAVNSNLYWRRGQDMYLFNRVKPEIYRNMHIGNNIGAELNASYNSEWGTTGLGVDLRKEFLASNNLGHRERFITQLFFEHHFALLNDRLQISPGISWANFTGAGDFFYPGLDVGFDFTDNHKIYGNVAKVHRIPTFTDLFYVSKTEQGNPTLQPENALSYEAGYRYQKNSFTAKASFFGRDSNNAIDWLKNSAADKWTAMNIGRTTEKGVEAEISQRFDGVLQSYSLGYMFLDKKLETESVYSRYVLDNLKHQLVAKLENRIFKNFTNQLTYRYQERANGYSYHLLEEKFSYRRENMEVFVLINNLTNTKYTEAFGVPMPQRWFHLGFSYHINL